MQTTSVNETQQLSQSEPLFHEAQLGAKLNECVHAHRKADFSLMLAMLTDDVREHSQFFLPKSELKEKNYSDEALRKAFQLPKKAPLSLEKVDDIEKFSQAPLLTDTKLANIHLSQALAPLPLAFRDDPQHIPTPVLSDTSIHCQRRIEKQKQHKEADNNANLLNSAAFFNAKAWLDTIKDTLVKTNKVSLQTA